MTREQLENQLRPYFADPADGGDGTLDVSRLSVDLGYDPVEAEFSPVATAEHDELIRTALRHNRIVRNEASNPIPAQRRINGWLINVLALLVGMFATFAPLLVLP